MTWASVPPATRELAERILTERQLHVYRLRAQGLSWTSIALHLQIDRATARQTWTRADQRIRLEETQ